MIWILKTAFFEWLRHRSPRMGAALAYYSVFSLGPLLLLVTAIAGIFFGQDAVRGSLSAQFDGLLGRQGGEAVEALLAGASSVPSGTTAAIVAIVLLVVSAVGVVAQLKDAMNTIWNVADPADFRVGWYVKTYAISLAGVVALGLLLAVSLVINASLATFSTMVLGDGEASLLWQLAETSVAVVILTGLFASLFKWFPDTDVTWRDVLPGAFVTSILFNVGKFAIGWYVGNQSLESTYGAAASFIVLLIWIYYSAQIVLFGAELTHAYAVRLGSLRGKAPAESTPHTAPK